MKQNIYRLFIVLICFSSCHGNKENTIIEVNDDSIQSEVAIKNLTSILAQNPDSVGLRLKLVLALDSVHKPKEALMQIDSLIKKDGLNYGLWFTKGQVAEDAGDTLLAMESYTKAAKIYESPDALLSLANLYAETKNERAITICSRIKALGQGKEMDANCDFIVGIYYARIKNSEAAVQFFDQCIAQNYTYMEAYIEKGMVYFDKQNYSKALEVFNFASGVNRLYADTYYYQARCYEMMNKKDSAILKFQQSLGLDKTLNEAKEGLTRLEKK